MAVLTAEEWKATNLYKWYKEKEALGEELRETILFSIRQLAGHDVGFLNQNNKTLMYCFQWRTTPQGHDFWKELDKNSR